MKASFTYNYAKALNTRVFFIVLLFTVYVQGNAQGRVLINEYLPWPNNACGVTAEFIELYNFGPGPMNIGCYIVTDGDYSITIPPNTIIQAGQFYVLAGQNVIPQNCGNDLRNVTVDLNWNTCGCTSAAIPTTGDGLMTDGGGGNEQVILLDPNLKIVDAVIRDNPFEPSALITTSTVGGICTARIFDIDTMNVKYETIGESTGRGNSMARRVDGGCGWLKDTQESAGDPNNTAGTTSELDASLTVTSSKTCTNTGAAIVTVTSGNFATIFPMLYTLARDADSNNIYDLNDVYLNGADSTANTVPFSGLVHGSYRVAVATELGCDLTMFNFVILGCYPLLPIHNIPRTDVSDDRNESIVVFPNPVKENCTVLINTSIAGKVSLIITDMFGKTVQTVNCILNHGKNEITIQARSFSAGIYYIHFMNRASGRDKVVKIIKASGT